MSENRQYDILVVDDELGMREGISRVLKPYGHNVLTAGTGREAMHLIETQTFDVALLDLKLPDADGLDILDAIQTKDPLVVNLIITAYATLETAVEATKRGAFDYLAKPFTPDQLLVTLDRALDRRDLLLEADRLKRERDLSLMQLSTEKSRFKTIINCMTDGVLVTNRNNEAVLYNSSGSMFLKNGVGTSPGTSVEEAVVSDNLRNLIVSVSTKSEVDSISGIEVEAEDRTKHANCAAIHDEEGQFLGTVTVFRDITDIKELERMKSRFVSLVAHELKAPVAVIKGYLDVVVKRAAGDNQGTYDGMIERSRERADGLLKLIGDLLEMSRLETGKITRDIVPIDLKEAIHKNVEFFNLETKEANLNVVLSFTNEKVIIKADREELDRIITNLLSNAIKYNRENGTITVTAEKKGDKAFFAVADTGIGMTDEEKECLFQEFYRAARQEVRKKPGTGLGLSNTRRMVEANFGVIKVDSEYGKGSTFTVILPSADSSG